MELTPDEKTLILGLRELDAINPPWREGYNCCYTGNWLRRYVIPETVEAYKKKILGDKTPPQQETKPTKRPRKCTIVSFSDYTK